MPGSAGFSESRTGDINRPAAMSFYSSDLPLCSGTMMHKQQLIDIFRKILDTEEPFEFLAKLTESELETLIAGVRGRIDREK
ncbi:MAG: hypothetical protein R6U13_08050 [Desulfatiglandaceae bacterium]